MKDPILTMVLSLGVVWIATPWPAASGQEPTLAERVARAEPGPDAEPVAKAVPVATPATASHRPGDSETASVAALVATLQLNAGNTQLRGQLLSAAQISMKTAFGDATVPLSEVAGIKLASQGNPATTVVLHNGDSITGACDLDRVDLQTQWGRAEVQGTAINSILFVENVTWVSEEGLNGTRWELLAKPDGGGAHPYKVGDRIVVARTAELKTAEGVVGMVHPGEVFTVGGIERDYLWVKTRDNNRAGWLKSSDARPADQADGVKSARATWSR